MQKYCCKSFKFARQGKLNLKEFDLTETIREVLKPFTLNPVYRQMILNLIL